MRNQGKPSQNKNTYPFRKAILVFLLFTTDFLVQTQTTPSLNGVGLFEKDDGQQGVSQSSFAGGTEILFDGQGMSDQIQDFSVIFTNYQLGNSFTGPPLSTENAFNSNPANGRLQYTTPSATSLLGLPYEALDGLGSLTFSLSLNDLDQITGNINNLQCTTSSFCQLVMSRAYTPILHYLNPRVVYHGSEISYFVNPKSATKFTDDLLPFVEARISGQTIDFSEFYDDTSVLTANTLNSVRGNVYEVKPSSDAPVNIKFRAGNAQQDDSLMISCSYDNSTCYKVKAIPVINSITATSGYTSGGQTVTIAGYGFQSNNVNVNIDGQDCPVKSNALQSITCVTLPSSPSTPSEQYIGTQGLQWRYYTASVSQFSDLDNLTPAESKPGLSFELPINVNAANSANKLSGYFKAPATTNYKFYMSCDDRCILYLSKINKDPTAKEAIITINSWTQYRNYLLDSSLQSASIPLTAGEYYYIEGRHIQYTGGDHFTVSVEIQQAVPGHQNSMREAQRLSINPTIVLDTLVIQANNTGNGAPGLMRLNLRPQSGSTLVVDIPVNSTASVVKAAVASYYINYFGADINVRIRYFDSAYVEIYNASQAFSIWYYIECLKALPGNSVLQFSANKAAGANPASQIRGFGPTLRPGQRGNLPISGSFQIGCAINETTLAYTTNINALSSVTFIRDKITAACPQFLDKINVIEQPTYLYIENGRDFLISFTSYNQDVGDFIIISSPDDQLVANNYSFSNITAIPYGTSIFYEPIPFDFLYTSYQVPQVQVTVDGLPAVCADLDCSYSYVQPQGSITSYSISGSTLRIEGNNLPSQGDIQSLLFANVECIIVSVSEAAIECSLPQVVAGYYVPYLVDENGIIPVSESANSSFVPLIINSASPSEDLNPFGGDQITIYGGNMPPSLDDGSVISITFSDGTKCIVVSTTSAQIECVTEQLSQTEGNLTINITVNGVSDTSLTFTIAQVPAHLVSVTPSIVSPVLKAVLVISVDGLSKNLSIQDLTVKLVDTNTSTGIQKPLFVVAVNNDAKTIQVKYSGIYSGIYSIQISQEGKGAFNSSNVTLQAIGQVTNFFPRQGSFYGGTLVTITGYNFSTVPTDNPVKIGMTDCLVQNTSNDQIICLTTPRRRFSAEVEPFLVFLRTSEEAVCNTGYGCNFTWLIGNQIPTVLNYSISYNSVIQDYEITLVGTGFPSNPADVTFRIDGFMQTVRSSSPTQIIVQITKMLSSSSKMIEFYTQPLGSPNDNCNLFQKGITLEPLLVSTFPSVGSPSGSIIKAVVKGVGIATKQQVTLANLVGLDLCDEVKITDYAQVSCRTKSSLVLPTLVKAMVDRNYYSCLSCTYSTTLLYPTILSGIVQPDKVRIVFTGTNFFTTGGYSAGAFFGKVPADTVQINSANQLTATWNLGVPQVTQIPEIYFESSTEKHWATNLILINNQLSASLSADQNTTCSFAGGCTLSITQPGLASLFINSKNYVTVCGQQCSFNQNSTFATTYCTVPPLVNNYSAIEFCQGNLNNYIMGEVFASNMGKAYALVDGKTQIGYEDSGSTCFFGTYFATGYVGLIREARIFLKSFKKEDISRIAGKLIFQGSNDGVNYTNIMTVDQNIHPGWNFFDFEANLLRYRFYRYFGTVKGACQIGEMSFRGIQIIDDNANRRTCPIALSLDGQSQLTSVSGTVQYTSSSTPTITEIYPRYGKVQGGDTVTFTGNGFSNVVSDYIIKLDNVSCAVISATENQVQCTTGKRPGLYSPPTLYFFIQSKGKAITNGLLFYYGNYWSESDTWGGDFQPIEGDTVHVPSGLNLLVDVDSTPILNAVIVEGSLIFAPGANPDHHRTFDAHYILVRGGYMEVGTEEFPYTSKLTITMHGKKEDPELPTYGNKVLAVREGTLEMHGLRRTPTWTELESSASFGATQITLREEVDWQVGEVIVIAPTDYSNRNAEQRTIIAINNTNSDNPILTLDAPLKFAHYAQTEYYGNDHIDIRAEVALLTRNIVFQGDPETSEESLYGATLMIHGQGSEDVIGRIEYVEFRYVGQAYQIGRYPIHFHLIGTVFNSYITGNSIHHSFNRAVSLLGIQRLRIIRNVAFNIMGHSFFMEKGAETKNLIQENLVIMTIASWSLMNTDQTPASYWISNPDNSFIGNRAAGSDRHGFWINTRNNVQGSQFTTMICPQNTPLGEFSNNLAHSNGQNGLFLFPRLVPRKYPCLPLLFNETNWNDPYSSNPLVTANFVNFTSFRNRVDGILFQEVGDVRLINAKVVDNRVAGIEYSKTPFTMDGTAQINSCLVVGYSQNVGAGTSNAALLGIITANTENFQVHNVRFFNFNKTNQAALGSCSQCSRERTTDSGARTTTFSGLQFDSTVKRRIRYAHPYRDIYYDLDGSLTGNGSKSWATPYWQHNLQPECQLSLDVHGGIVCSSQVQVRRVAYFNYGPDIFWGAPMKIIKWDSSLVSSLNETQLDAYTANSSAYSVVPFKIRRDPYYGWAMPYVTGHTYKIHWSSGLDFTRMQLTLSEKWTEQDYPIIFVTNFTDVRAKIEFLANGQTIANSTIERNPNPKGRRQFQTGDNLVLNQTDIRKVIYAVSGKNKTKKSLVMNGYRCDGPCFDETEDSATLQEKRWSSAESWQAGRVPREGEDATIPSGINMILDIAETPILNYLRIDGRLTFEDGIKDLHLRAKYIHIKAGQLAIGNETNPFQKKAKITLYGEKNGEYIAFDNAYEGGNKIILNTGKISIYGKPRNPKSRLLEQVYPGQTTIKVGKNLDWEVGEWVGLAASTMRYNDSDTAKITDYNPGSGIITLDRALSAYHYGASESTASQYSAVDIRNEVYLLSRNVKISGEDIEAWGCQVVTSDYVEISGKIRAGRTFMSNVEIYNCSQYDTYKAALRFEGAYDGQSEIKNSAIHHGLGYGVFIQASQYVRLTSNVIFSFTERGIEIGGSNNITLQGNDVSEVFAKVTYPIDSLYQPAIGVSICASQGDICYDIKVYENIASGTELAGFVVPANDCNDDASQLFKDNIAHSIKQNGVIIYRNFNSARQNSCLQASRFSAYKCGKDGAVTYASSNKIIFKEMVFIDNGMGGTINIGREGDILHAMMTNIIMYGETAARDCYYQNECLNRDHAGCNKRTGLWASYFSSSGRSAIPQTTAGIPIHKIMSDASWGGYITYTNLTFSNFKSSQTWCGNRQTLIEINDRASDYQPKIQINRVQFDSVSEDAIVYLFSPPQQWASLNDCGNFPCSGPSQVLIQFTKASYTGNPKPSFFTDKEFQVIPNNPEAIRGFQQCSKVEAWNAYRCTNGNLGILLFESLDSDKLRRTVTPIYVNNNVTNSSNKLNSFMDHAREGFFTSQLKLSRWPALIQTGTDVLYDIVYTGTPPNSQRFALRADSAGARIRIKFGKPGTYVVTDMRQSNLRIRGNDWDDRNRCTGRIQKTKCGENRWEGVNNVLEFYISAGCEVTVNQIDSIQAKIRLSWTLEEFYAAGGTTTFVDRVAGALGIHASTIKVVSVYQGSVIIEYQIAPEDNSQDITELNKRLTSLIKMNQINFGAPVLNSDATAQAADPSSKVINITHDGESINNNNVDGEEQTIKTNLPSKEAGIDQEDKQNKIIIGLVASLFVLIIAGIIGFCLIKKYKSKMIARKGTIIEVQSVDANNATTIMKKVPNAQDESFEPQYHPKLEIGNVFGSPSKINEDNEVTLQITPNLTPRESTSNLGTTFQTQHVQQQEVQERTPLKKEPKRKRLKLSQILQKRYLKGRDIESGMV